MVTRDRAWLVMPAWLWLAADVALTLAGQPNDYWKGDYTNAVEANPLAYPILARGPWPFLLLAAVWAMLIGVAVACLSHQLAGWFVFLAAVVHAVGGGTWLARLGSWGWALTLLYLLAASEVSWWCWRRSGWLVSKRKEADDPIS
jgi:hypothetical protein